MKVTFFYEVLKTETMEVPETFSPLLDEEWGIGDETLVDGETARQTLIDELHNFLDREVMRELPEGDEINGWVEIDRWE